MGKINIDSSKLNRCEQNHQEIRLKSLFIIKNEAQYHAIDQVLQTGVLFNNNICPVVDADGDRLIVHNKYLLNSELVRIEKARFGSGNILSTYYYVWYLDTDFKTNRIAIDAKYPNGILNGAIYQSDFEKYEQN